MPAKQWLFGSEFNLELLYFSHGQIPKTIVVRDGPFFLRIKLILAVSFCVNIKVNFYVAIILVTHGELL